MKILNASIQKTLALTALGGIALLCSSPLKAQSYSLVKLVSDLPGAAHQDPNLVNAWGLAALPGAPWWVSDNGTGLSTLYDQTGNIQGLVVTIPPSASAPPGSTGTPTGIVANASGDFGGAAFLFDSEDGSISAWSGAPSSVIKIDKGAAAVYKGMTSLNHLLYAANFRAGAVEVYNSDFTPHALAAGAFTDPMLPAGYAPFNVAAIGGKIYVAFAEQDSAKHDEVDGPGLGYVDVFGPAGTLLQRLQHGNFMNAPWGLAIAPANFGTFSGDVLVGNFGNGAIVAFDATTGRVKGALTASNGKVIVIPGLWAIEFGLGGSGSGPTNWLYFTAGIKSEAHGLFGYIH